MAQGNVTERSGGDSTLWFGREGDDSPITALPENKRAAGADAVDKIIQARFPFTDLGFDLASEQGTSRSIIGSDAATKRTRGQIWSEGTVGTELLPNSIVHWLRPIFNALDGAAAVKPNVDNFNASETAETTTATGSLTKSSEKLSGNIKLDIPSRITLVDGSTDVDKDDEITIVGKRRIGLESTAVREMSEKIKITTAGTIPESTKYFYEIDEIIFPSADKAPADSSGITYNSETYKTEITGFNKLLFKGATLLMSKGGVPYIAEKVLWNTMNMTIGDAIDAEFGLIGGKIEDFRFLNGKTTAGIDTYYSIPEEWVSDVNYPIPALDFAPAWGGVMYIGDSGFDGTDLSEVEMSDNIMEFSNLVLNINLNLESKRSYRGSPYRNQPKKSSTSRECIITPTVYLESGDEADFQNNRFQKWNDHYLDGGTIPIVLKTYNWLDNGKQYWQEWRVLTTQLIEVPTFSIDDPSTIERDLAFLCLPKSTNPSNELTFTNYADRYGE